MFEARGSILRGINGNVSFTVIIFFYLNIHRIFLSHLVCLTYYSGDQIEKNEMGGACSAYGGQ